MIDVHAHLNFQAFDKDRNEVIKRSFDQGISHIINIGSNFLTSQRAIEIAYQFKNCWAAVGLHPIHIQAIKGSCQKENSLKIASNFNSEKYYSLIEKNKHLVKAIGETGLDFYRSQISPLTQKCQEDVFLEQLVMAKKLSLPAILHCRGTKDSPKDAYLKMLEILKKFKDLPQGEIHCFSSDWQVARQFLDLGFYIGFTGSITFKNASQDVLEAIKKTPLNKILAETDCPFLAPCSYRGKRNEPSYVRFVIQKIASLKNLSFRDVEKNIDDNAFKLFRLNE